MMEVFQISRKTLADSGGARVDGSGCLQTMHRETNRCFMH
jgi:hypothetical protein